MLNAINTEYRLQFTWVGENDPHQLNYDLIIYCHFKYHLVVMIYLGNTSSATGICTKIRISRLYLCKMLKYGAETGLMIANKLNRCKTFIDLILKLLRVSPVETLGLVIGG